jgi:phosphate-starvation-inducible protein E
VGPSDKFELVCVLVLTALIAVIIALEFKRSPPVMAERRDSVVQVRSVVLIALLAIVRTDANPRITAQAGLAHPIIGGKARHGGASRPPS